MTDLLAARLTMAISLGFHIVLAAIGMIMPFLMTIAHYRWLKNKDPECYRLTKAWSKGVAILFATGAVSGTALSFELGLLWPGFMKHAGPIIGLPFSLEGAAFFLEAIALGLFLYGWGKMNPWLHWFAGLLVGCCGVSSGILVVSANSWMNSPAGFRWENGQAFDIDPIAAFFNDAWISQASHMTFAAFTAVGFAVAGVHAFLWLRGYRDEMHRVALKISLSIGSIFALIMPISGHFSAQDVAERQPIKLAAMEAHFHTSTEAPIIIGGIPNEETMEVDYAIEIPGILSFLAFNDFSAEVKGLEEFPREQWPPVLIVHLAFQVMVGIGSLLAGVALLSFFIMANKREWLFEKKFLILLTFCSPLGFIAIEAGWIVTEVGRQPWIIYGIMTTAEALTPVPGQVYHLALFVFLYIVLTILTTWMLWRQLEYSPKMPPPDEKTLKWAFGESS